MNLFKMKLRSRLLLISLGLTTAGLMLVGNRPRTSAGHSPEHPIRLVRTNYDLELISPHQWTQIETRLRGESSSPSETLHQLMLRVADGNPIESACCTELLAPLMNEQKSIAQFGSAAFNRTRYGLRFRPQWWVAHDVQAAESHRDQCLALFSLLGLKLDQPILHSSGTYSIRDLLGDSLASFNLHQEELAWTGVAYALYLPPKTKWKNRFDERFDFDQLTRQLMNRRLDLESVSCGGLHVIQALVVISKVDRLHVRLLSASTRRELDQYIDQFLARVIRSQGRQGYWEIDWHLDGNGRDASFDGRLIATSHIVDVLSELNGCRDIPRKTFQAAGLWLKAIVLNGTDDEIRQFYCPLIHAAVFLRETAGSDFESLVTRETN